jgi:hypothetical protein
MREFNTIDGSPAMIKFFAILVVILATLNCGPAEAAQYPASVLGYWYFDLHYTLSCENLGQYAMDGFRNIIVTFEGNQTPCQQIIGNMPFTGDAVQGYYCPSNGSVSLLHLAGSVASPGDAYQVITAQLSPMSPIDITMSGYIADLSSGKGNFAAIHCPYP